MTTVPQRRKKILIIDDEKTVLSSGDRVLTKAGYDVALASDGPSGLKKIEQESFSLVLLDLRLQENDGLAVLQKIKEKRPKLQVVIISGYGTVKSAVEAMKLGAKDFLSKPFTPDELREIVKNSLEGGPLLEKDLDPEKTADQALVIYKSKAMAEVLAMAKLAAPTGSTVLLTGESGTGKGLISRLIHQDSERAKQPFINVDCGTLVETLFESELFGHVKGSFTGAERDKVGKFELAQNGTIFFDEISNINLEVQAKLLRAVEDREVSRVGSHDTIKVNVRILAATNQDLYQAIDQGKFREDLFYRLNVVFIHLPPLRERKEDIPPLIDYFFAIYQDRHRTMVESISPEAVEVLMSHNWPGNVRELSNTIERQVVLGQHAVIRPEDLNFADWPSTIRDASEDLSLNDAERQHIVKVLERFAGRRTDAARALGIDRSTLRQKIKKYGL
ncbi:MAG: sigma-54-dependent Fis family transcriptional regulator [Deltaproteobacteria bacterium]|nr:sigma-54-dependent Fis family transcriptional regulator [Deltaproteobacteria bacterium]